MNAHEPPGPLDRRDDLTFPRAAPARTAGRAHTWWGKAWLRAVEEAAYDDADLRRGRALTRAGAVGGVSVGRGSLTAAVSDSDDLYVVTVALPVCDEVSRSALIEAMRSVAGGVAALLDGDLPHALVEHAEEAGVEVLPNGYELESDCSCSAWVDPCPHALAVMLATTALLEGDPFLLIHLRGMPRLEVLGLLHEGRQARVEPGTADADLALDTAEEAVLRAQALVRLFADPATTEADVERLL